MRKINWRKMIRSPKLWYKVGGIAVAVAAYFGLSAFASETISAIISLVIALISNAIGDVCEE